MRKRLLTAMVAVALLSALLSALIGNWAAQHSFSSYEQQRWQELRQSGMAMENMEARPGQMGMGRGPRWAKREAALLSKLTRAHLLSALVSTALATALGLLLAERLARPLRQLEQQSRRYAAGETELQLPTQGHDEVAQLAHAFADLTQQIEARREREKALLSDIAHELRAPLTVLQSNLEALEDGVYSPTPERFRELGTEVEGLGRLVGDLRTLSLADAGHLPLNKDVSDLAELAARQVALIEPLAHARGIQVLLQTSSALVHADTQRLGQVLTNLLDNAVRHTPSGGRVAVQVNSKDNRALLSVHDGGAGIPEGELERIFQRFYRTDASRSREQGGTGLGLAIARSIVELHDGTLHAQNHPAGGAVFEVDLPQAAHK